MKEAKHYASRNKYQIGADVVQFMALMFSFVTFIISFFIIHPVGPWR